MLIHAPEVIADYRARGWWGSVRLHDLLSRHAQSVPQREAVLDPPNLEQITGQPPRRISWAELHELVQKMACVLASQGLAKDDVAVVQMANGHALLAVYLACWRLGVVVSPVVPQYREHELEHVVRQTRAKAIVVTSRIGSHDHAAMACALARRTGVARVFVHGGLSVAAAADPVGPLGLLAALAQQPADASLLARYDTLHPVSADDAASILWTSGSEGRAKGVARSHNDWMVYGPQFGKSFGVGDGVRLLNGRPLTTHGSFVGSITPWLFHAGTLVNHHPFALPLFIEQLKSEDIHFTALAPAILSMLVAKPELLQGWDRGRLRCVGSGSAPLSEALMRGFEERFGVQVINFFGSTEGASLVSAPDDMPDAAQRALYFPRFGLPGRAWKHPAAPLVQTRLVDLETGRDIEAPGRPGELRWRGPMVMTGYFNAPELSAAAFDEQGFFRSGDLFEIAGESGEYLRFAGRAKDIIIRGGFNISAEEIENLVASHAAVAEVAVVGYPDERLGEKVCACVVLRPGKALDLPQLVAWLRDECRIGAIKLPERLLLLDALPRSPNNKVVKSALREQAARAMPPAEPPCPPLPREPR